MSRPTTRPTSCSTMQSRWKEIEAIHSAIGQNKACSILTESWHRVMSQTLSASSDSDSFQCPMSPAACQHCHQLLALSAITMVAMFARRKKDKELEEIFLKPLLQMDLLQHWVQLLQHCCQFLRYEAHKALMSVISLPHLTEIPVQFITESCVKMILHQSGDPSSESLEPLQLLCSMLSGQSKESLRCQTSGVLAPYLATLYECCCQNTFVHMFQILSKCPSDETEIGNYPHLHNEQYELGKSGDSALPISNSGLGEVVADSCSADCSQKAVKNTEELSWKNDSAVKEKSPGMNVTKGLPTSSDHTSYFKSRTQTMKDEAAVEAVCSHSDVCKKSSTVGNIDVHKEQQQVLKSATLKNDVTLLSTSETEGKLSDQAKMVHYMYLCLIQKVAKHFSSLETVDSADKIHFLNEAVLITLITNHTMLFRHCCVNENDKHGLLVKRKFLDILDRVLDYTWFRTKRTTDTVYERIAVHFLHSIKASDCSWSFQRQRTFIGGCKDKQSITHYELQSHGSTFNIKEKSDCLGQSEDGDCSHVLLLLVTVIIKSCAYVFRADHKVASPEVTVCATLLNSMHHRLHLMFNTQTGCERSVSDLPSFLDWLPLVYGEQDDRWLEALLCLLDIAIYAQHLYDGAEVVKTLVALLDPHHLFIQFLHQIDFNISLLIDWLTSPETCLLAYLTRYLRVMIADFPVFYLAAASWDRTYGSSPAADNKSQSINEKLTKVLQLFDSSKWDKDNASAGPSSESLDLIKAYIPSPQSSDTKWALSECKASVSDNQLQKSDFQKNADDHSDSQTSKSAVTVSGKCGEVNLTDSESVKGVAAESFASSSTGLALLSCYGDDSDDNSSCKSPDGSDDSDDNSSCKSPDRSDDNGDSSQECNNKLTSHTEKEAYITEVNKTRLIHHDEVKNEDPVSFQGELTSGHFDNSCDDDDNGDDDEDDAEEDPDQVESTQTFPKQSVVKRMHNITREKTGQDSEVDCVNRVIHLLTSVRQRMQRLDRVGLLVYNPKPLVSLIQQCEALSYSVYTS